MRTFVQSLALLVLLLWGCTSSSSTGPADGQACEHPQETFPTPTKVIEGPLRTHLVGLYNAQRGDAPLDTTKAVLWAYVGRERVLVFIFEDGCATGVIGMSPAAWDNILGVAI